MRALRNWLERDFHGITAPVLKRLTTLIPRQLPAGFDRPPLSAEDLLHDCLLRSLARCDDQRVRTRGETTALLQGFARNVLRNQRKRAGVRRRIAARLEASVSAR